MSRPLEKSQNIWFLRNTGPDPLTNHKATKLAFNAGPSSTRQLNADNDLVIIVFGPPSLTNYNNNDNNDIYKKKQLSK